MIFKTVFDLLRNEKPMYSLWKEVTADNGIKTMAEIVWEKRQDLKKSYWKVTLRLTHLIWLSFSQETPLFVKVA
jgi:hypothetical protein